MATVRMKRGDKYADIYDSPETIKQAQLEGYSLVEESKKAEPVKTKTPVVEDDDEEVSSKSSKQ